MATYWDVPVKVPTRARDRIIERAGFGLEDPDSELRLRIRFDGIDVTLKDLAAYLQLIDAAFGRTDPKGFRSYAQRHSNRLEARRLRAGSTEIEMVVSLLDPSNVWRLVFVYLVLRTGPSIIRGEAIKNWIEAGRSLGEAVSIWRDVASLGRKQDENFRLPQSRRRSISAIIEADKRFQGLTDRDRRALVRAVEELLFLESNNLPAASRFVEEYVIEIGLDVRRRQTEGE